MDAFGTSVDLTPGRCWLNVFLHSEREKHLSPGFREAASETMENTKHRSITVGKPRWLGPEKINSLGVGAGYKISGSWVASII